MLAGSDIDVGAPCCAFNERRGPPPWALTSPPLT